MKLGELKTWLLMFQITAALLLWEFLTYRAECKLWNILNMYYVLSVCLVEHMIIPVCLSHLSLTSVFPLSVCESVYLSCTYICTYVNLLMFVVSACGMFMQTHSHTCTDTHVHMCRKIKRSVGRGERISITVLLNCYLQ